MSLNIFDNRGMPLDRQRFTWRDMVQKPISKLDDDAYTRVRIILLNGKWRPCASRTPVRA